MIFEKKSAVRKSGEKFFTAPAFFIPLLALVALFSGDSAQAITDRNIAKRKRGASIKHENGDNLVQAQAAQQDQKEKPVKRGLWSKFYHFRKDYVYPVNRLVNLCSLGTVNGLNELRYKAGYDQLPGGIWCTKWWVGIIDAAAAEQPAEVIVRDDVIRRLGYIALYLGMQAGVKKFGSGVANRVRATVPDFARLYLSNMGVQNLENNRASGIVFSFLGHLILDKAARVAGKIVVDPFALAAYYTVKYKKNDWWGKKPAKKTSQKIARQKRELFA